MGEHESAEGHEGGEHALHTGLSGIGWLDKGLGVAEGLLNSPIGHGAEHLLQHNAPNLMPGLGAFIGPLGFLAGGAETIMGVNEMAHGDVGGSVTAAGGLAGMVGGGASTLGALSTAAGGEAVMGVTAAAAAPVAAVAAAAGTGLAVGSGMAAASDSDYTRTGFWGADPDTGRNYSAMDAASNWGMNYDREHGVRPGDWSAGGAARAALGGIGAGFAGTAQAGWNAVSSW